MLSCRGFAGNRLKTGRLSELARAVAFVEAVQLCKFRRNSIDLKFLYLG